MKSLISYSVAVAVLISTAFVSNVQAQQSKAGIVAVLDVAKVFKADQEFEAQMASIKQEADRLKNYIQGKQEAIKQEAQQVSQMEAMSPARQQAEGDVEQKQTALRTEARQAEAALLTREAKVYYDTYQRMQTVVAQVAEANEVALVIRFDSAPIDQTNRQEVIKGVNRTVVYKGNSDMTSVVIQSMVPHTAAAGGANTK